MREQIKGEFVSFDGARIVYRHCASQVRGVRRAVILLHPECMHSEFVMPLADELGLSAYDFFAWDARGCGESDEADSGATTGLNVLTHDLDRFVTHIRDQHGIAIEDMAFVGQSLAAVVLVAWAHDYAPFPRALVLSAPAFKANFGQAASWKALTHDADRVRRLKKDPLVKSTIPGWILDNVAETAERVVADAWAIRAPTQMLVAGQDSVAQRGLQDRFFENIGAQVKERHFYPDLYHDLLGEKARAPVISRMRAFLLARFQKQAAIPTQIYADQRGYTFDEAERLNWPLEAGSERDQYWSKIRNRLQWGAKFSEGLRIASEKGFESPESLNYVCRNQPQGKWLIGRMIDRRYLDASVWRAIRARPDYLRRMLREAMRRLREEKTPVQALDIAAGHGEYVLDALADAAYGRADSIRMWDANEENVQQGRRLIEEKAAEDIAGFRVGDGYDSISLATMNPKPTLAIVSWLYELCPDNKRVKESLEGLATAIPVGGYLVYSAQPWNPQLEFLARFSKDDNAPIRRRRSQQEMDELVASVRFRKLDEYIDPWGIFSIALAQRVAG